MVLCSDGGMFDSDSLKGTTNIKENDFRGLLSMMSTQIVIQALEVDPQTLHLLKYYADSSS